MAKTVLVAAPCYNEGAGILTFLDEIEAAFKRLGNDYQGSILIADDGSEDSTRSVLRAEQAKRPNLQVLYLRRNYGHQAALFALLENADADYVIFLDADLQDDPALIPELVEKTRHGANVVIVTRKQRGESLGFRFCSKIFYWLFRRFSGLKDFMNHGTYSLIDRESLACLKKLGERSRYYPGLLHFIGGRRAFLETNRNARAFGKSKVGWRGLFRLALNALFSFSNVPLRFFTAVGTLIAVFSFLSGVGLMVLRFTTNIPLYGWTSMICAILFLGGVQLLGIGILGEYISRTFLEAKARPQYFIQK